MAVPATLAQGPNVLTWGYDNTRQRQNTQETTLTPTNVNTNTFGKLFSHTVDGQIYAQPLYVANLTLPNQTTHNVIFVADEHDSVYAFDADSNGGADSAPLWQASLLSTAHGAAAGATTVPTADVQNGTGDIHPEIGISATPVIDINTGSLFVVAKTKENGTYVQRLHALNILTGNEQTGSPVAINASVTGNGNGSSGGKLSFSTLWQNNRTALGLFNGNIYIAFGSHGDDGPWHGWVIVYNETTLKQTAAICTSPNGNGDGIWMSGAGLPIDTVAANGRAFLVTGNGDYTSYPPLSNNVDYGDSIVRYDLSSGGFSPTDAFTPFNQSGLSGSDLDQGSGGILLLPDQAGANPHLLIQIGKEGRILVLNRDKLNGYAPGGTSNTNALQDITGALGAYSGLWSTPAYWNGNVYMWAENDSLKIFPLTNGVLATRATAQSSASSGFPGASPVVSANGNQNGIVWAIASDLYSSNGSSILYAFNALNVATELYASNQNSARDDAGPAIKFTVPVVTNGKVYVGAGYQVDVYGLLNVQPQAPAPSISPAGGQYGATKTITITDTLSGASIYYTTDGSTPTTASLKYAGGFALSTAATVQAIASASGYLQSTVASATYTFSTQAATPQFSPAPGTYTASQSVTLSDATSGAQLYYTTDGSTPSVSSTRYTAPIAVTGNLTIKTLAVASGLTNSSVATAAYSIQPAGTSINFGSGFANVTGMTLNGSANNADDTRLQLTTGLQNQSGSAFWNTPINIQSFTTDFSFQLSDAQADGFTFTLQNVAPTALGGAGGGLGYGPDPATGAPAAIAHSVAIKFDFYNNSGEGSDSTGLFANGATPTVPAVDMTSSGIVLASGDTMAAHITYDGANLVLTLTDNVVNKSFTHTFPINIASTIGSTKAYAGFTGGTGGETASQKIESWTYTATSSTSTQAPAFSPAAGSYATAQKVTLSDGTSGAVIYYTLDGSTPTTASTVYGAAINIDSGTVTINAIAQAPGSGASSVSSATYTIQSNAAAAPVFSPGTGTYTSAQSVTITDSTPGATIYYTTDGSTPTMSSTVFGSAIQVTTNETLKAVAVAPGFAQSAIASAAYVIQSGSATGINFAAGFTSAAGLQLNGASKLSTSHFLEITDGGQSESGSAFWTTPVNVQAFTTNFTFQLSSAQADGFTFTLQNAGPSAIGGLGGGLGYGPDPDTGTPAGITKSVAIKFDIYSNSGEGVDSTGLFTNGATPTLPAVDLTSSGISLLSGDTIAAQIVYNGTTLTLNLTDTVTGDTFSHAFTVDIPTLVGGSTAYAGFTGGTGGYTALQNIKTWTFTAGATQQASEPVFSPTPGSYASTQNVVLSSATPGSTIYYTVDGSTPTHASAAYGAPIVVSGGSLTIRAFSSASGYQDSPIVVGAYQIQAAGAAATPTFTPASGASFSSTLSVSLADATPGAKIYYTTDGSTPTTSSPLYGTAFALSASTTVHAIAVASGYTQSSTGSASYTYTPATAGAPTADDFTAATLNTALWQVQAPAGGSATVSKGELLISVPGGSNHDPLVPALNAVQVVQSISNSNFDVAVKIDSVLNAATQYYGQGLMVEGDAKNYIRFELGAGGSVSLSVNTVVNGGQTSQGQIAPFTAYPVPTYLRMQRVGTTFTAYWSTDGTTWNKLSSFNDTMTVTGLAPYGWNYSATASQAPALTASFDWFHIVTAAQAATATPAFTPASGASFSSPLSVSLSDATPGAVIHYTTDGTTPTSSSPVYASAFTISASTTVQALAVASGYAPSSLGVASYTYLPATSGSPVSDEFTTTGLNTSLWQVRAPAGGSATVSNGELQINVPGGSNHDPYVPALDAVQVVQPISNVDFDVAVKIDSTLTPSNQYYGYGLLVEGDAGDYVRYEVGSGGGATTLTVSTITGGTQTTRAQINPFSQYAVPTYLRMQRAGATFTAYWSTDGQTWNQLASFSDSLAVTGLAPYASNYNATPSQATAITALFDWFHNRATDGP